MTTQVPHSVIFLSLQLSLFFFGSLIQQRWPDLILEQSAVSSCSVSLNTSRLSW